MINSHHPALVGLVKECLNNAPDRRPATDDLLARLQRIEGGGGRRVRRYSSEAGLAKDDDGKRVEAERQEVGRNDTTTGNCSRKLKYLLNTHPFLQETHEAELAEKLRELEVRDRESASMDQEIQQKAGRIQQLQNEMEVHYLIYIAMTTLHTPK